MGVQPDEIIGDILFGNAEKKNKNSIKQEIRELMKINEQRKKLASTQI